MSYIFSTQPNLKRKSDNHSPRESTASTYATLIDKRYQTNSSSSVDKGSPHDEHNTCQGVFVKYKNNDYLRTDLSVYRCIDDITSGASFKLVNNDEYSPLFASNCTGVGGVFHERGKSEDIFSSCGLCYDQNKEALIFINI